MHGVFERQPRQRSAREMERVEQQIVDRACVRLQVLHYHDSLAGRVWICDEHRLAAQILAARGLIQIHGLSLAP